MFSILPHTQNQKLGNLRNMPLLSNLFIYLFISSLFKVDLHLAYKKPMNVNSNTTYISVNKFPCNNDNNKSKYLIVRQN